MPEAVSVPEGRVGSGICGASSSPFVKTITANIDFWSPTRFFSGASFHRGQRRVADITKGSVPMRRVFILYFCLALRRGRGASLAAPQPCPAERGARAAATNSGRCGRGPALAGKGGRPPARGWRGERGQAGERSLRGSSPSGARRGDPCSRDRRTFRFLQQSDFHISQSKP